jgi:hypothetical protein
MANEKQPTINDLKAMAYDILANIDFLQKKLNQVNAEIAKQSQEQKENGTNNNSSNN